MSALRPVQHNPHIDPETLARYVDGRDTDGEGLRHLRHCELCRARANDARLLRALIAGGNSSHPSAAIPLDAATLAGYHDQALPADQMTAVDRRLLRDDSALLELIELRLGLNGARRAEALDAQVVARAASAFATGQSAQSQRVASLGTIIVDREADRPVFRFHAATPEKLVSSPASVTAAPGGSGSYPAPAARRELALPAGRHTFRVRMTAAGRIEFFVFDEQHFRPANGVQISCEPEQGATTRRATSQSGFAAFELPRCHARLRIDAGDRWLIELR